MTEKCDSACDDKAVINVTPDKNNTDNTAASTDITKTAQVIEISSFESKAKASQNKSWGIS